MRLFDTRFEKNWKVVDDRIASPDLLHKLRAHTQHHSSEVLGFAICCEGFERCALSASISGCFDTVHDHGFLSLCFLVINFQATESGNDNPSFFVSFASKKPSRRFG